MSKQWAQKKSGSNSSLPVQKSSSSQRPFTAPVYDAPAPKQTPSVQAKRRNVDWNRVTVEAQSPAGVQAKLSVGAPGDKYEQEADATANKVMTMPAPEKEKPLQREMAPEKKEEEVQTKPLADGIQREMAPQEKEEEVQTKLATEEKSQAGSNLEIQLSGTKGGGSALSDEVRSHMEPRFGANFSSVRVHTDSAAVQMNRDLGAQAFTHGSDIYYGGGKSPGKDELTAHELTPVVQQNDKDKIQRVKVEETQEDLPITKKTLKKKEALEILQGVASQKYSATPEEMDLLMDIAKLRRGKGIREVEKSNFSSRMEEFNQDPNKTNYVVPSHTELDQIKQKQAEVKKETGVDLTENQAWSLVLAELRGKHNEGTNREKALKRLEELNSKWNTSYTANHLDVILEHLRKGTLLATNYTFSKTPGENTGSNVSKETLASELMKSKSFKQLWQTGASQASTNVEIRGAVEESMGYGSALKRTKGKPLMQQGHNGKFEPDPTKVEEMPKYAGLVSKHQTHGVAPRYGASVVYWKQDLKNRVTHTPGDSWNLLFQGALMSFTSAKNTEVLFAHTDEVLLRLAAAEATGQDQEFLEKVNSEGGITTDSYIETQIHGKLTWEDVDSIVIGLDEENPDGLVKAFKEFALKGGYNFTVRTKPAIP